MTKLGTALLASIVCLTGCAMKPLATNAEAPEAATIEYVLPETRAKIDVTLTLEQCSPSISARANVTVSPYATPSDPVDGLRFQLRGSDLESFWKKRDIKIELHPHGALKSVNASSKDATASIIGGFIKLGAALAAGNADVVQTMVDWAASNVKALRHTTI